MDTYQPLVAGGEGLRRFGDLRKMTPLDLLSMYMVNLVDFHGFEASLDFSKKSGQSVQMTMPASRASKFCAQRRAESPEVFSQSMISEVISGIIKPWPECQPEESRSADWPIAFTGRLTNWPIGAIRLEPIDCRGI